MLVTPPVQEHNIHHLPVVSNSGILIGIITYENIHSSIDPFCLSNQRKLDLERFEKLKHNCNTIAKNIQHLTSENQKIIYTMKLQSHNTNEQIDRSLEELAFNSEIIIDLVKQIYNLTNNSDL